MAPTPFVPDNESERLRSLRAYDVLPTLIEPIFDEFVALTAQVFSLPISLIAVVEEAEVFYPANHGMPGNDRQRRAEALCSTAIEKARAVVYHDLLLETAATIPAEAALAAQQNELRFYAGALLRLPDQSPLGTLCIIDRQPRTFSATEQQVLDQLAALVSQAIAVRHACLYQSADGLEQWEQLRTQLQEELRELTALVRYLFTRHGVQIPVPAELLAQVERRLHDFRALLDEHQCS
ncbi:GAF domain-containing protein [Hymenobacter chitinivorans]|uniref:GAF domain-containing protein n=1 Tax=Hymenobacter chitinivorans DSM 11115 TaxID=1121954 RepID=A0A2M9BN69_9BACT|nr:GAF domain-containing protein [Hymenobacter chitinivorans]PJJ59401.1 GAF domain-containing protein [Hymenobacter chitinivorans DSM 11115]